MKNEFKLKFVRKVTKNLLKGNLLNSLARTKFGYKIADMIVKNLISENGIIEVDGFIIKKGRTTRLLILSGDPEPATTSLMKTIVKQGMNAFDLGSNIGWHTLNLSKLVSKTGHVYSFEPEPSLFKIFQENIKLNHLENVSAYQMAVSDKNGIDKFTINSMQDGDNRLGLNTIDGESIDVRTISLDDFCKTHNLKIDFLKMDIEGSEPKVLRGMKRILRENLQIKIITEFCPAIIEEMGSSPKDFLKTLENDFIVKEIVDKEPYYKKANIEKLLNLGKGWTNLYCFNE